MHVVQHISELCELFLHITCALRHAASGMGLSEADRHVCLCSRCAQQAAGRMNMYVPAEILQYTHLETTSVCGCRMGGLVRSLPPECMSVYDGVYVEGEVR